MSHFEDGWFFGVGTDIVQDATGAVMPNVVGRFRDHERIDGPASRAAGAPVFKTVLILESRLRLDALNFPGKDIAAEELKPDADPRTAAGVHFAAMKARFPSAWADYEAKKTPPTPAKKPRTKKAA